MPQDINHSQRDLIARVATMELLVADLIDLLWRLDPSGMDHLARDAARDLDIQHTHYMPGGAEHQRERLFAVLRDRSRKLAHRRDRTVGEHEPAHF